MTAPIPADLDVLRDISARFEQVDIPYMLTGSLAVSYYTTPRTTSGIDLVAELEDNDIARVVTLFEADYYLSPGAVADAVRDRSSFNLVDQNTPTKVDVFPKKLEPEPFRTAEFARRQRVTIEHFSTWIVTAEDLILAKLLWTSPSPADIHMQDVRTLLHTTIDVDYVESWVRKLGLDNLWAEAHR
jgi:hypothetical protein